MTASLCAASVVALLDLFVGARYCAKIIRKQSSPRIATWLIFEIGVLMSLAAYFASPDHSIVKAALNLTDAIVVTVILALLFIEQRGTRIPFTANERLCLVISFITLAAWAITRTAWIGLVGFQVVMSVAYFPTIESVWQWKPGRSPNPSKRGPSTHSPRSSAWSSPSPAATIMWPCSTPCARSSSARSSWRLSRAGTGYAMRIAPRSSEPIGIGERSAVLRKSPGDRESAVLHPRLHIHISRLDQPFPNAAASVTVPGRSFTCRMNLPCPPTNLGAVRRRALKNPTFTCAVNTFTYPNATSPRHAEGSHHASSSRTSSPHRRIASNHSRAMAPSSPACASIYASIAGSCSTAPSNRNRSVFIAAPL